MKWCRQLTASFAVAALLFAAAGCRTAEEGTMAGAASGALLGGIIGNNSGSGHTPEGAIIGAVAGGLLGNQFGRQQEQIEDSRNRQAELETELARQTEMARIQTVWVLNSNGSKTPVRMTRTADGHHWVGPKGEYYRTLPTPQQLHELYGF